MQCPKCGKGMVTICWQCDRDKMPIKENAERQGKSELNCQVMPLFEYDKEADVLYISFGKPQPCIRRSVDQIVIGSTKKGKLNGITIIDYIKKVT